MAKTGSNCKCSTSIYVFGITILLASVACLASGAPLTSDLSDENQKQSSNIENLSPSTSSHLVKRSAPAPYSGHSIMRFGRAAHSIMHFGKRSGEQVEENVANEPMGVEDNSDDWRQLPILSDGANRFVMVPLSRKRAANLQEDTPFARDNVFMHFG